MKDKTQADRLTEMMQKHQIYDHYTLALPLIKVKSSMIQKLKEGDILLLELEYLTLVLLEGKKVFANLLPFGTQGYNFEVTALKSGDETDEVSPKYELLILALDKIQRKKLGVGDIIQIADVSFDKINILTKCKKIAQGSLVRVDSKIALQIDKVEK